MLLVMGRSLVRELIAASVIKFRDSEAAKKMSESSLSLLSQSPISNPKCEPRHPLALSRLSECTALK